MNAIKLLLPILMLASCATPQAAYKTQEQINMDKAIRLESLGLKEYTVITRDSTYQVQIPIDSTINYTTFAKYFKK